MQKINQYITQAYGSVRHKSKRRGESYPLFTKDQLRSWLYKMGLERKWIHYVESGYDKREKPSIDRIDDYKGYIFDNMQLITWHENNVKGVNGDKHHKNSNNRNLFKKVYQYDKHLNLIGEFDSVLQCSKSLKVHPVSVSRAVNKSRKTLKGFILTHYALTGSELTVKE